MSYKIDGLPSKQAYKEETADFWEVQAIKKLGIPISNIEIIKIVGKGFDEINNDGIDSEEDFYDSSLDDVFIHINQRLVFSKNSYPFKVGRASLTLNKITTLNCYLYLFLLLATRLNMKTKKIQGGIDGALLFEHISANAAKNFFGDNAESIVFGTGVPGGFKNKVKDLIKRLNEGDGYRNSNTNPPTKNDDGIDVVVWKDFADKKIGKLIGFGQCKTGTSSWRNEIHKLKPSNFCNNWFSKNPVLEPIPIVFITDTMNEEFNFYSSQKGFLIFNRFRIMEYGLKGLSTDIKKEIRTWVKSAVSEI